MNRSEWRDTNPIRAYRAQHHLSMMDTASALASSMSALQQWESGVATPSDEKMNVIAALLGVRTATLAKRWDEWLAKRPSIAA